MLVHAALLLLVALQPRPFTPTREAQRPASAAQPAPLPLRDGAAENVAWAATPAAVSGAHLVQSPNVFRGVSATGEILEKPAKLTRAEEVEVRALPLSALPRASRGRACLPSPLRGARPPGLAPPPPPPARTHTHPPPAPLLTRPPSSPSQLVQSAWFFTAIADANRELSEALRTTHDGCTCDEDDLSCLVAEGLVPSRDAILTHMRAAAAARASPSASRRAAAGAAPAQQHELPEDLGDTEYRLREALGRAAYNKLFLHNQGLIYAEVNKLWPNWKAATVMEKADFLQEGAQGLLRAIRLFDPAQGVRFSTYATWHVRAYVLRAVRDKCSLVRLPQALQKDMVQIRKARYRYAVENQGHAVDGAQLACLLQWDHSRVDAAVRGLDNLATASLDAGGTDAEVRSGQAPPLMASVASRKGGADTENALYSEQLVDTLSRAMRERDPRRRQIIRLKYGLEDGVEWTYPQLAARFNTTANVAKGIVRSEVAFLRKKKRTMLQPFMSHHD